MRPTDHATPGSGDGNGRPAICPDDNALVRFVDGRSHRAERAGLEAHLAACAVCAGVVAGLARAGLPADAPTPRRVGARTWLVAAALLIAAALVFVSVRARFGVAAPFAERLVAAARAADQVAGGSLAGLPLGSDELRARLSDDRRGAGDAVWPRGVVVETTPTLRWSAPPIDGAWRVVVVDADGADVLRRTTGATELAWPDGAPALRMGRSYAVEVTGRGAFGAVALRGSFRVAGEDLRARLAAVRAAIAAQASGAVADVLLAHWALREDLRAVALTAAREARTDAPEEEIVQQTLYQALLQNGLADEAAALQRGGEDR